MTQNPYQQGPPPGWNPQTGQQWPQLPTATPFTQAAPAGPPAGDGFGTPDNRPTAGDQPAVHQLVASGRLVLIRPLRWNIGGTKFNSTEPEEQMIVDIIVCDGPPIAGHEDYNTKVVTPFAVGPAVAPFFIGATILNKALKDRCRSALEDPTTPGTVLGRLVAFPPASGKGFPWNNMLDPTEADRVLARPIYAAWDQIKAAVPAPPVQHAYGQPGYPQTQGPPPGYQAQNPYGAPPQTPPW